MKNDNDMEIKINDSNAGTIAPHRDLVITKWIGLSAACILAENKEAELLEVFPPALIRAAKEFEQYLSVDTEREVADEFGAFTVCELGEGGIFAALWKLAQEGKTGVTVNLREIPIRQETVEICEYFDVNPYQISSKGSLLIVSEDGNELVSELDSRGIPAAVAGRTTKGKDKILKNGSELRYLNRPEFGEMEKVFQRTSH